MPNGKPGDHPLTDIVVHGMAVYGSEADALILKIGKLSSNRALDHWWESEIGWNASSKEVVEKAKVRLAELEKRVEDSGWDET